MIILTLIFAILNMIRGGGIIPRPLCAFSMGVCASIYGYYIMNYTPVTALMIVGIVFIGMWLGLLMGWGKYFAVFTGNMNTVAESEVKVIDWAVNATYGYPETVRRLKIWSFFAMSLRGLMFYPIFIGLSFFNPLSLLFGLGVLLMGCIYGAMNFIPEKYAVRTAEGIYGGVLGLLISLSL